jgi:hypothetical protein
MKFDIYGRFRLEVQREKDSWVVYRLGLGKRAKLNHVIIPNALRRVRLRYFWTTSFMSYPDSGKVSGYYREKAQVFL